MTYLKSIYTGQIYEMEFLPKFLKGYEIVHKTEFLEYCKKNNIKVKDD